MGKQHAATCQRLRADVRLVCDPDLNRARELAGQFDGARAVESSEAIDWSDVDAAFSCTPPFARGPAECAAARAGVALFMEKPIGLSLATGVEIAGAAREGGGITAVGYMNRYRNSVRRAKQWADEAGVLGAVIHWVGAIYRVPWWGHKELSGGQINEQCTHAFDLLRHFCGEIVEVSAMSQPGPAEAAEDIDAATAVVCRAKSGTLGMLYASCAAEAKQIGMYVFTKARQISLDGWNLELRDSDVAPQSDVFGDEATAFLEAVETGDRRGILSDLADALRTQAVVDAAVRALETRRSEAVEAIPGNPGKD
jgi:predicted dehydrogenase